MPYEKGYGSGYDAGSGYGDGYMEQRKKIELNTYSICKSGSSKKPK
jgi:hypothetical protein